jgi:Tubulin binding cofactor C
MHDSMDVRVYLSVASNPVIENCSAIAFAEYPLSATLLDPSINGEQPPNVSTSDPCSRRILLTCVLG